MSATLSTLTSTISILVLVFLPGLLQGERFNYCPRNCIRAVQQFPFSEICICPEYCRLFCCSGYYFHSPVHGACPTTCGAKSRPLRTECCLPGGFTDPSCIVAQKRWFDVFNGGIWWWPSVFNDTSVGSRFRSEIRPQAVQRSGKLTAYSLVKTGHKKATKTVILNEVH